MEIESLVTRLARRPAARGPSATRPCTDAAASPANTRASSAHGSIPAAPSSPSSAPRSGSRRWTYASTVARTSSTSAASSARLGWKRTASPSFEKTPSIARIWSRLKILPDAFADDPDRLARFQREAQVLTSLNHPNIGGIHGLEDSHGVKALVLELIEGPTLADRINQGAIPIDEALIWRASPSRLRPGARARVGRWAVLAAPLENRRDALGKVTEAAPSSVPWPVRGRQATAR